MEERARSYSGCHRRITFSKSPPIGVSCYVRETERSVQEGAIFHSCYQLHSNRIASHVGLQLGLQCAGSLIKIRVQRARIELYGAPNLYRLRLLVLISSCVWLGLSFVCIRQ